MEELEIDAERKYGEKGREVEVLIGFKACCSTELSQRLCAYI